MTANQRRPGFRLPWSSEEDGLPTEGDSATASTDPSAPEAVAPDATAPETDVPDNAAPAAADPIADEAAVTEVVADAPEAHGEADATEPADEPAAAADEPAATDGPAAATAAPDAPAPAASGEDFMRDLVAAMRQVADEARDTGLSELRTRADDQISTLEADAEKRREELRARADADVAGVAEWATAEAERIRQEAEQKVVARRGQLDQELTADASRTERETSAVRDRVAAYERELAAYHAKLAEINDPAAFAAAAKQLPTPPSLTAAPAPAAPVVEPTPEPAPVPDTTDSNGVATAAQEHDAEVVAARPAEEPAAEAAPEAPADPEPASESPSVAAEGPIAETAVVEAPASAAVEEPAPSETVEPVAEPAVAATAPAASNGAASAVTEVVVKGLGSFGAITGFRQSLSGVDGIESVALSLGQTGEFVFRASHAPGFDVRGAIVALEGDGATVEDRPEGGLRVTLERAR